MHHFPAGDWIDLVRGGLSESQAVAMRAHLDEGCAECRKSADTWRLVVQILSKESRYRPPEVAVENVKAARLRERPYKWLLGAAQFSRLLFDSFTQPLPAMVRAIAQTGRQLIYESGSFTIDLRLDADTVRKRIFLVGQILRTEKSDVAAGSLDVALLQGGELFKKTITNPSGEFDFEYETGAGLELLIDVRGERAIVISLDQLETTP